MPLLVTRFSRQLLAILFLFSAISLTAYAQFPVTLKLDATSGAILQTPPTKTGAKYRITVTGTYSQWPQFANCRGVDAVWVYEVPDEEINAGRWPPKQIFGTPFVEIPHWVGDDKIYAFPPKTQFTDPLFEISFRKYLGFRIDGEPLSQRPLDQITHRYQTEKAGNGQPISFQILDSTYNVQQKKTLPRYEDNCGSLTVKVEEILDNNLNICGVEPIVIDKKIIGLQVRASILQIDTSTSGGVKNILASADQVGIVENGKFICPDSIVCNERSQPLSVGLVFDRSGSMAFPISDQDNSQRIIASRTAIKNFVDNLNPKDSALLITFSTDVTLDQNWTGTDNAGKASLKARIDNIIPDGNTALNAAILRGIQEVKLSRNPKRALVVLTDGVNNEPPMSNSVVMSAVSTIDFPIYIIALGLTSEPDDVAGYTTLKAIAAASPRGKTYAATNAKGLDSVYQVLSQDIGTDECCRIFFKIRPCTDESDSVRVVRVVYASGDSVISQQVTYTTDCAKSGFVSVEHDEDSEVIAEDPYGIVIRPNPLSNMAVINFTTATAGIVNLSVSDMTGRIITSEQLQVERGDHSYKFDAQALSSGVYYLKIEMAAVGVIKNLIINK